MGHLRVNKVIYSGNNYHYESPEFDKNIILIEGENGTGKSTLCNLIYFALGGEVKIFRKANDKHHVQITSDTDNYVDLYVNISGINYVLRRYIADNDITVIPYEKRVEKANEEEGSGLITIIDLLSEKTKNYPVNRHSDNYIFSDWILEKLGISVVELFHGYSTFKINFTNLMRLMYHDQQPDPESIYKKLDDRSALVADSEMLRNAIFELLIGKSYSEYYDSIVLEKKYIRKKVLAQSLVDEYKVISDRMRKNDDLKNINFLQEEIIKNESQLDKLHLARMAFKYNRSASNTVFPDIETFKSQVIESELKLSEGKESLIGLLDERSKLSSIMSDTGREVEQVQKIIFSHDQLNLFTADTCPYCLTKVDRVDNHCVCGAFIEESQYERFFYTSQEYKEILKVKVKTLETIELALEGCNIEVAELKSMISDTENNLHSFREKLKVALAKIDEPIDIESLNDIDDKILDIREDINELRQLLEIETKLKKLQDEYDDIREKTKEVELSRKALEIEAKRDITKKVGTFSRKYNELMVATLPDCRSARIRLEDYLPSINEGEYKEASSRVSIRLMYYITFMHLALEDESVTFPRFLLVDTPETAGIELTHLINCISKFEELEAYDKDYQVILSTGLNKYPDSLIDNRVLFMPNKQQENMLLQKVN